MKEKKKKIKNVELFWKFISRIYCDFFYLRN